MRTCEWPPDDGLGRPSIAVAFQLRHSPGRATPRSHKLRCCSAIGRTEPGRSRAKHSAADGSVWYAPSRLTSRSRAASASSRMVSAWRSAPRRAGKRPLPSSEFAEQCEEIELATPRRKRRVSWNRRPVRALAPSLHQGNALRCGRRLSTSYPHTARDSVTRREALRWTCSGWRWKAASAERTRRRRREQGRNCVIGIDVEPDSSSTNARHLCRKRFKHRFQARAYN